MKEKKSKRGSQQKQEELEMESITYKIGKDGKERAITKRWKVKIPRINSMVKFDYKHIDKEDHKYYTKTFPKNEIHARFLFMGEIANCPGHCFIYDLKKQKMLGAYHVEDFIELTEDEV